MFGRQKLNPIPKPRVAPLFVTNRQLWSLIMANQDTINALVDRLKVVQANIQKIEDEKAVDTTALEAEVTSVEQQVTAALPTDGSAT